MDKRGNITIFSRNFCLRAEKLRKGTLLFSENFWPQKLLWMRRGYHDFPWKNFLSHSAEKFRWGTL